MRPAFCAQERRQLEASSRNRRARREGKGNQEDPRRKASLIHPIIDFVIRPLVRFFDIRLEFLGEKIYFFVLFVNQIVEFGVEHPQYFTRLIADNFLLLNIVQGRNGKAAFVFRVDTKVNVPEVGEIGVDGVGANFFRFDYILIGVGGIHESPA